MAESPGARANQAIGIDLRQFHQVFFEEAGENLEALEQRLLGMDLQSADDEALNAIFRCAHSVKGGAAAFGFQDVTELTHEMETLLDKLRRHELAPAPRMVDLLLTAGDVLKAQLAYHQGSTKAAPDTTNLLSQIRDCCGGAAAPASAPALTPDRAPAPPSSPQAAATAADLKGLRLLELSVNITADPSLADSLVELFQEISDLGQIEPLDGGRAADGLRRFKVSTSSSDSDLMDLFSFHASADAIGLRPLGSGYGFYNGAPGAPMKEAATSPQLEHRAAVVAAPAAAPRSESLPESATLRVAVDKVDQLINLVGELVITQAMLAQRAKDEGRAMSAGLADLERNTRDLQTAVMSIRMMPMSLVFNRFPRMLRDLAARLDKRVELVTLGESTELDKGMVEKIIDPLNHLLRNSCDHGIELPAERLAKGKPAQGRLTLAASHQGGSILIEVRDDGRGLNRDTLLRKARKQGLSAPDSLSDSEVWNLIFAPGFSTAEVLSDVSGRGVGMDVVKKNISALGGTVEIDSAEGLGMSVRVRLPLTLAITDGMTVSVADDCYILPLASVIESLQVQPGMIKTLAGSTRLVEVRGDFLPVIDLQQRFQVPRVDGRSVTQLMVVVESEGSRVALLVDELLGQQQVVVKNLEANYRKVPDVSGATILGDGRVALILDIAALVHHSHH